MRLLIIVFLLILTSCSNAQVQIRSSNPDVDEELKPYVQEFNNIIQHPYRKELLKNTTLIFENIKQENKDGYRTIGQCNYMFTSYPSIEIDIEYWRTSSELSKQFTVYHELGHCVCNLPHSEEKNGDGVWDWLENLLFKLKIIKKKGYLEDGCPASIMHPYDFSEECMGKHYNYYLMELRKSCQ